MRGFSRPFINVDSISTPSSRNAANFLVKLSIGGITWVLRVVVSKLVRVVVTGLQ